jgi:hypothetical protein
MTHRDRRSIGGGHEDAGDGRNLLRGMAEHAQAIDIGQVEIREDHPRPLLVDQHDALPAHVGDQAGIAPAREETSARVDQIGLVIHDEKLVTHRRCARARIA